MSFAGSSSIHRGTLTMSNNSGGTVVEIEGEFYLRFPRVRISGGINRWNCGDAEYPLRRLPCQIFVYLYAARVRVELAPGNIRRIPA